MDLTIPIDAIRRECLKRSRYQLAEEYSKKAAGGYVHVYSKGLAVMCSRIGCEPSVFEGYRNEHRTQGTKPQGRC